MKTMGIIDRQITSFYAPLFFEGLKNNESQINVWVVGAGRTVIMQDILSTKLPNCKFINYACDKTENSTAREILINIGANLGLTEHELGSRRLISIIAAKCNRFVIKNNKKVVFIGNMYEVLPEKELIKLLDYISQIVSTNKRNIFSIVNCINKPTIEKLILKKPSILAISTRFKFMPVLQGTILNNYIIDRVQEFNKEITETEIKKMAEFTGGILSLTKELIRSYPDDGVIDIKFKSVWNLLPKPYQKVLCSNSVDEKSRREMEKLGILNLNVFKSKQLTIQKDPIKFIAEILEGKDQMIFKMLINSKNRIVSKDQIAQVIWGTNYEDHYSDWTIDQTISRFRKKVEKLGISRNTLETIKGKGYKWNL